MSLSGWITLLVVVSVVWGGFGWAAVRALRSESRRRD